MELNSVDVQTHVIPRINSDSSAFTLLVQSASLKEQKGTLVTYTLVAGSQVLATGVIDENCDAMLDDTSDGYSTDLAIGNFPLEYEWDLSCVDSNRSNFRVAMTGALVAMVLSNSLVCGTSFCNQKSVFGLELQFWTPQREHFCAVLVALPHYEEHHQSGVIGNPIVAYLPWVPFPSEMNP